MPKRQFEQITRLAHIIEDRHNRQEGQTYATTLLQPRSSQQSIRRRGAELPPDRRPPTGTLADEMPRPLHRRRPRRGHVPRTIRSTQSCIQTHSPAKIHPEGHACRGRMVATLGYEPRYGAGSESGDGSRARGGEVLVEELTPPRSRLHRRRRWWWC
jgi:hypothetical protein